MKKSYIYLIGFILLAVFTCVVYGPVFRHIGEENYFSFSPLPMTFVLNQPLGHAYWGGRFCLLIFQNQWIGGLILAALLTLTAWAVDYARLNARFLWNRLSTPGVGFVVPAALMGFFVYRGYNLYLRNEPSKFMLGIVAALLVALLIALLARLFRRTNTEAPTKRMTQCGWGIMLICTIALSVGAYFGRQNVILSCYMQNCMMDEDWEAMNDAALTARHPDRSVAAYNVIALNQMGQVLERSFELDYDFQKVNLDNVGGSDEGINYIAECNFHAGLVQAAYHTVMERMVVAGPRLSYFKLMATCALLSGENALCEKYLTAISKMPFQGAFIENMKAMLNDPEMVKADAGLARVISLYPRENTFEQNYRSPAFLGYNVGVLSGTDETLNTSVAAALYSKDLENVILRSQYLQQKRTLPNTVMQALVIASLKRPGLLDAFPSVKQNPYIDSEVRSFIMQAAPFAEKRRTAQETTPDSLERKKAVDGINQEMANALKKDWLGSYMYYYYCGNLNQTVQKKAEAAVN